MTKKSNILKARLTAFAAAAMMSAAATAQNIMVVHPHGGTARQFNVATIDSMKWENETTLRLYLNDKSTQQWAIAQVDSVTWMTDDPADPITIGDVHLGSSETFYISEESSSVRATNCQLNFSPTVVDEYTKLTVRTATSAPPVRVESEDPDGMVDISGKSTTINADLGNIHQLDGMVDIRIPFHTSNGSIPSAAYYNETTKDWEPIDYDYDTRTGEVVIHSSHLSVFTVYEIKSEHTVNARLNFLDIPYEHIDTPVDELAHMIEDGLSATVDWADFVSNWWGTISQLGFDITYGAFKAGGMDIKLYEKYNEKIGKIGTMFSCYDILRAGLSGDHETAGMNTLKLMIGKASSAAADAIGTSVMSAAMCAVAIIDYALNQMWETSWSDRQDLYRRCYERYYQSGGGDGLKHHPMRARDWYNTLYPVFKEGAQTIDGVKGAVDKIIDDYVWEYWNLPDDEQILYWQAVGGPGYSYTGGLSQALKKELADNQKAELANDVLPIVFKSIGDHLRTDNYIILQSHMRDYAKMMNQVIRLEIVDGTSATSSEWEGCTVRFKDLPSTILDPKKWQCTLNSLGKGTIRFRLYAYASENVQPTLEVVGKDGSVLKEIPIVISEGVNTITLGEGAQSGFLLKEIKSTTFAHDPEQIEKNVYIKCTEELDYYVMDIDWPIWLNFKLNNYVPDYIFFQDVREAFTKHPNFTVGTDGKFGASGGGFTLEGTMDSAGDPKSGSGTFTIKSSFFCKNKSVEEAEKLWHQSNYADAEAANLYLDGQVEHDITGTFTCAWSDEEQQFIFTFTGNGTFKVDGRYWNNCSGYDYYENFCNMPKFKINGTNTFTQDGTATVNLTIGYELKK